ncbi:MAG: hypothetical protein RR620_04070 [Clostridium sp.]
MDSKKRKVINIVFMVTYLVVFFLVTIVSATVIYCFTYNKYTVRVIGALGIILLILGIVQLFWNTIDLKYLYGRIWGAVIIFSCVFLIQPYNLNGLNEILTVACNYDEDKINEMKSSVLNDDYDIDSLITMYSISKFEQQIDTLESEKRDDITFYYDDINSKDSIEVIEDSIINFHSKINTIFKLDNEINAEIVILNSLSTESENNSTTAGYVNRHNNKIYLNSKYSMEYVNDIDREFLERYYTNNESVDERAYPTIAIHEYTHKLTNDIINNYELMGANFPKWFYEGLAVYSEYLYNEKEIPLSTTNKGDLKDNNNFDGLNASFFYERAGVLMNNLLKNNGENFILNLLDNMQKGNDIYIAIEEVTGESFDSIVNSIYIKE